MINIVIADCSPIATNNVESFSCPHCYVQVTADLINQPVFCPICKLSITFDILKMASPNAEERLFYHTTKGNVFK
jgi:hypothetical protein